MSGSDIKVVLSESRIFGTAGQMAVSPFQKSLGSPLPECQEAMVWAAIPRSPPSMEFPAAPRALPYRFRMFSL